jgi:hypothetical protein
LISTEFNNYPRKDDYDESHSIIVHKGESAIFHIVFPNNMDDDQGEPGLDYNEPNLNPLICDLCKKTFSSLDQLGEHQKKEHDM